jgi:hypothetical protein
MSNTKITEYVTLVSNDGYEFKLLRSAACIAGTIKKALDPACRNHIFNLFTQFRLLTVHYSRLPRNHTEPRRSTHDKVCPYTLHYTVATSRIAVFMWMIERE